jgi:L-rhamnose mutarotase
MSAGEARTSVFFAKLLPDKADRYRELHDRIPAQIETHLREDGIEALAIYAWGLDLCMIVRKHEGMDASERSFDEAMERWWQRETGECFASFWQPANLLYRLGNEGGLSG